MLNKAVNFINGAKGGTGKTMFARLLYATLDKAGIKVVGIDSDRENPEFSSFHSDPARFAVAMIDCLSIEGGTQLFSILAGEMSQGVADQIPVLAQRCPPDAVILDMPAASSGKLREQFDLFDLVSSCGDIGYAVTMISVISTSYAPVESIGRMMDHLGDQVRWIVVKNEYFDTESAKAPFLIWEESKERKRLKKYGGVEISMPQLPEATFRTLQLNYTAFTDMDTLPLGDKLLAKAFVRRGGAQIELAGQLLGLPMPVSGAA